MNSRKNQSSSGEIHLFRSISEGEKVEWGVVAIGVFDGVHAGHRKIIEELKNIATSLNLPAGLITFDPHPDIALGKNSNLVEIYPVMERVNILKSLGISMFLIIPFTREFAQTSAESFVMDILKNRLKCRGVVVGENFVFGRGGCGGVEELKKLCQKAHIKAQIVRRVKKGRVLFSSSRIRKLLQEGKIEEANEFLTTPYYIKGKVIEGKKLGREIGFPTINIIPSWPSQLKEGVYAVSIQQKGEKYPGVANWGKKPTFDDETQTIEVHVLTEPPSLEAGEEVKVEFLKFLRETKKFKSLNELRMQISKDVKAAKEFLKSWGRS